MKKLLVLVESIGKAHLTIVTYLLAYLVLFPALHYKEFGVLGLFNQKRWTEIFLLLVLAAFLISNKSLRNRITLLFDEIPFIIKICLSTVLVLGLVSAIFSDFPDWAFLEVSHYLLLIIMALLVAGLTQANQTVANQVVTLAVWGTVVFYLIRFVVSYLLYLTGDFPLWPGQGNEMGLFGFSNIRSFNHIQTLTLPILTVLLWNKWEGREKKLYGYLVLVGFWWLLVIASGARGTVLSVLIALGLICLILKSKGLSLLKVCSYSVIAGSTLFLLIYKLLFRFNIKEKEWIRSISEGGSSGRYEIWTNIIPDIFSKPLLGHGPMHYASFTQGFKYASPHNWFLQFSYEWGILVSLILLFLFGYLFFYAFKKIQKVNFLGQSQAKSNHYMRIGLLWSCLAAFLHSFLSGIFINPLGQIWLVLIGGTAVGLFLKPINSNIKTQNKLNNFYVTLFLLIGISGFIYWGIKNDMNSSNHQRKYFQEAEIKAFAPRYWQQGKIGVE